MSVHVDFVKKKKKVTVQMKEVLSLPHLLLGAQSNEQQMPYRPFSLHFTFQDLLYDVLGKVEGVECSLKGIPADTTQGCICSPKKLKQLHQNICLRSDSKARRSLQLTCRYIIDLWKGSDWNYVVLFISLFYCHLVPHFQHMMIVGKRIKQQNKKQCCYNLEKNIKENNAISKIYL